jgi:putative ABC transport system substrate-binding protein
VALRRLGRLLRPRSNASRCGALAARYTAFVERLQLLGWTDGRNVHVDARWSAGNAADTRKYAEELVALAPDVILAIGSPGIVSVLQATRPIPIVFAIVPDPVGAGHVQSLSQPGATLPAL